MNESTDQQSPHGVREVAALFLRLGVTSFGGPAAHVAVMEEEVVRRRGWVTRDQFMDLVSAANLIPGPNSTELAIHLGYVRAGWKGLVAAGACFILPAVLIVGGVAGLYVRYGTRPEVQGVLRGVQPVVLAVVAQAVWLLGRSALRTRVLAALGAICVMATLLGANELLVLFAAALATVVADRARHQSVAGFAIAMQRAVRPLEAWHSGRWLSAGSLLVAGTGAATASSLFLSFLKIGSVLFGSGYVLLAFLRAEFVVRHGWLTEPQLLDAIAIGQVTPGPVFTSATFIGYLLAGPTGALSATAGIFLPAFVFVALSGPIIPRLRQSRTASAALDGINAGSLALMAGVLIAMVRSTAAAPLPALITIVSALLLVRYHVRATWILAGGALLGVLLLR